MAGTAGNTPADVVDLPEEARRYSLFAMLRLLEQLHNSRPRLGESRRAKDDALRLQQIPHLAFAPTDVHTLSNAEEGPAILEQYSFGVFGPNGSLPLHLTEHAFERRNQFNDRTFSDFVNLFHHRLISLFYRAWANSDPSASYDRPDTDSFRTYLGALMGLGTGVSWHRDAISDYGKFSRISQFGPHSRGAAGLEGALGSYFGVPITIRQFVGSWLDIPDADRCRLGDRSGVATLGVGASLGGFHVAMPKQIRSHGGPAAHRRFPELFAGVGCARANARYGAPVHQRRMELSDSIAVEGRGRAAGETGRQVASRVDRVARRAPGDGERCGVAR